MRQTLANGRYVYVHDWRTTQIAKSSGRTRISPSVRDRHECAWCRNHARWRPTAIAAPPGTMSGWESQSGSSGRNARMAMFWSRIMPGWRPSCGVGQRSSSYPTSVGATRKRSWPGSRAITSAAMSDRAASARGAEAILKRGWWHILSTCSAVAAHRSPIRRTNMVKPSDECSGTAFPESPVRKARHHAFRDLGPPFRRERACRRAMGLLERSWGTPLSVRRMGTVQLADQLIPVGNGPFANHPRTAPRRSGVPTTRGDAGAVRSRGGASRHCLAIGISCRLKAG